MTTDDSTANKGGRPLKYDSVEALVNRIEEYFSFCDNRIIKIYSAKAGDVVEVQEPEPYTMSGLAYWLGIDRKTLLNYSKRQEYFPAIKSARERIHMDVERRLMEKNPTGAIFNLKNNFGWKDKEELDVTTAGSPIEPRPDLSKEYIAWRKKQKKES